MDYSVVVPVYGNEDKTRVCLKSVLEFSKDYNYEIIVVSNGSSDEFNKELANGLRDCDTLLINGSPLGFAKATNEGIGVSKGDFIILLNNDTKILDKNWIKLLREPFDWALDDIIEKKPCGVAGPVSIYCPEVSRFFILFFCAMISRECLNMVGKLDEDFKVGTSEDIDFCVRAEDAGYSITCVPYDSLQEMTLPDGRKKRVGAFPINHEGGCTINKIDGFQKIYKENLQRLKNKHVPKNEETDLERAMVSPENIHICFREKSRYNWAKNIILSKLGLTAPKTILDIACGSGYGTHMLADLPNSHVCGVDCSVKATGFARENWSGNNTSFCTSDIDVFIQGAKLNTPRGLDGKKAYDAVVCFETLEHLENWPQTLEKLKGAADLVLVSVPYMEPEGFWGPFHVVHGLAEEHFPDFEICYMECHTCEIVYEKPEDGIYLMLMVYDAHKNDRVTVVILTCGRYDRLPLAFQSLLDQTYKNWELIIVDATPIESRCNVTEDSLLAAMLNRIQEDGHDWRLIYNDYPGPHTGHQISLEHSRTEYNFRMDDDTTLESDCLELLVDKIKSDDNIGAVAPMVLNPSMPNQNLFVDKPIEGHIYNISQSPQWVVTKDTEPFEVEHFHCSFLYRTQTVRNIGGWDMRLSPVGHREETDISNRIFRSGKKLVVIPKAIMWHYRSETGGIRSHKYEDYYAQDHRLWLSKVKENNTDVLVRFDLGMGDTIIMISVINALSNILHDRRIFVACSYPFLMGGVSGISGTLLEYNDDIGSMFDVVFENDPYTLGIYSEEHCAKPLANIALNGYGFIDMTNPDIMLELPCADNRGFSEVDKNTIIIAPFAGRNLLADNIVSAKRKDLDCPSFRRMLEILKKYGNKIAQVGSDNEPLIPQTDVDLRGKDIKRVFGALSQCKTYIASDSVIAHAGAALRKSGIVIFRNTDSRVFGHRLNKNIQLQCPKGYECRDPQSTFGIEVQEDICNEECLTNNDFCQEIIGYIGG